MQLEPNEKVLLRYPPLNLPLHELPVDCVRADSYIGGDAHSRATRLVLNSETEDKLEEIFNSLGIDSKFKSRFVRMAKEDLFNKVLDLEPPEDIIPFGIEKTKYIILAFCPSNIFYKDLEKPKIPLFSNLIVSDDAKDASDLASQSNLFTADSDSVGNFRQEQQPKVAKESERLIKSESAQEHYKALNNEKMFKVWVPIYQAVHKEYTLKTDDWIPFVKRAKDNQQNVKFVVSLQHLKFVDVKFKDVVYNVDLVGNDFLKEKFVAGIMDLSNFRNTHNLYAK